MKFNIPYYSTTGEKLEPIVLEANEKYSKLNSELISQALYVENNNLTAKAGKTKTKGEVKGGGKKPWKQKGTGRARAGSNRSPLWKGGGVTFGPTGINKVLALPKKMREAAMLSLLLNKLKDQELAIIEDIKITSGKTKDANIVLSKINDSKIVILAIDEQSLDQTNSWRNLAMLGIKRKDEINLSDLISKKKIVYTKKAFEYIENKAAK